MQMAAVTLLGCEGRKVHHSLDHKLGGSNWGTTQMRLHLQDSFFLVHT